MLVLLNPINAKYNLKTILLFGTSSHWLCLIIRNSASAGDSDMPGEQSDGP
jgi:hypothetical protein